VGVDSAFQPSRQGKILRYAGRIGKAGGGVTRLWGARLDCIRPCPPQRPGVGLRFGLHLLGSLPIEVR
jgi:hypothetical protein